MTLSSKIENKGFLLAENIFSSDEIDQLHASVKTHLGNEWIEHDCGKHQPNAVQLCPEISWVYSHPKLLDLVRKSIGNDNIFFHGVTDVYQNKLGSWHKDTGHSATAPNGYFDTSVYSEPDCQIYKVAVYLQCEKNNKRGFMARTGSHRTRELDVGEIEQLKTSKGDVLLFDIRVSHTAMLPDPIELFLFKVAKKLTRKGVEPAFTRHLKELYWWANGNKNRYALFFTFGAVNDFSRQFANRARPLSAIESANDPNYQQVPEELRTVLEGHNIKVYRT